jgi:hypothetical protein
MWCVVQRKGWKLAAKPSHMIRRKESQVWAWVYSLGYIVVVLEDFHFLSFLLVIYKYVKLIVVLLFKAFIGSEGYWVNRIYMCILTHCVLRHLTSVQEDWYCVSDSQLNILTLIAGVNISGILKFSNRRIPCEVYIYCIITPLEFDILLILRELYKIQKF